MLEYTLRTYQSPTRLVQRLGAIQELGSEASLLGMRRPLLVTDAGVKAAGLLDVALESLRRSDVEPVVFDKVRANPGVSLVDEGAAEYKRQGCDGLVAIGGGSSMDNAKGIGVVVAHQGAGHLTFAGPGTLVGVRPHWTGVVAGALYLVAGLAWLWLCNPDHTRLVGGRGGHG